MKIAQLLAVGISVLWAGATQAQVTYAPFQAQGAFVTGIRSNSSTTDDVVITGSNKPNPVTAACPNAVNAALYVGSLGAVATSPVANWTCFQPNFGPNFPVTSSTFYGPNTYLYDSSLGNGNVRAVGSFKSSGFSHPKSVHGMMYTGPLAGCPNASTSCWTLIDATTLEKDPATVLNTVPHSTMGNLVVGNWDTKAAIGHAFIYDIAAGSMRNFNPTGSLSVTAYGIWQNTDGTYTIAGGFSDINNKGVDEGYLVDYDPTNILHPFSHVTKYQFNNQTSQISHFDGISGNPDGSYSLTGVYVINAKTTGGFYATVSRMQNGSFGAATWTPINFAYPGIKGVLITTGNTVLANYVLGIFNGKFVGSGRTTLSYIATVN